MGSHRPHVRACRSGLPCSDTATDYNRTRLLHRVGLSLRAAAQAGHVPNIPDQWELRTPLLYCEMASSSSEYRLRHNIFDKSGDPFKLASALSRRYTQRADPHHHQHHLIIHLAARALASGLTSGRAGQVCTLRRSKPPRQSISLSARIRPGAQGLDGRDRVRGGRTTSSTLSYV